MVNRRTPTVRVYVREKGGKRSFYPVPRIPDLIRERVSVRIRNARAKGRKFGRPMRTVDQDRILQMRGEGQSLRQIAEHLGVGYGTVRERIKGGERKTPSKTDREKPRN